MADYMLPSDEPWEYQQEREIFTAAKEGKLTIAPYDTKGSGMKTHFAGGGIRDTETGKPRFDLLQPEAVPYEEQMLTRWAALMSRGAERYAARNWEQFSDEAALERAKSSAFRHFMQWFNGEADEDHAAASYFNIMASEYIKGRLEGKW